VGWRGRGARSGAGLGGVLVWGLRGGGGGVSENERGIELLLSEPEFVAWLEPEWIEGDDDDRLGVE